MPKILALQGLPGSGKTTWRNEQKFEVPTKFVSNDEIRERLGIQWKDFSREKEVADERVRQIRDLIQSGHDVIVDNLNLGKGAKAELVQLSKDLGVLLEWKFFDVPLVVCIDRDSRREKPVGASQIRKLYANCVHRDFVPSEIDSNLPSAYIFDLDGTLARRKNRGPFDWKKVGLDYCNQDIADLTASLTNSSNTIIIVSGRDETCMAETEKWLDFNAVYYDLLFMRSHGDFRQDAIVKEEIYKTHIFGKWRVVGVFDDRKQVVDMWRRLGLRCYQVQEADF